LIGGQKATVTAPAVPVTADTYAIRDTAKPRKPAGLVFDNAVGCFISWLMMLLVVLIVTPPRLPASVK
ncbi:MAG: hypothetical protein ACRCXB_04240, partial [Aeromonadaceae bacterium]